MASVSKVGKKWRGKISVKGNSVHVGMFKTRKAAYEACESALKHNSYTFVDDWLKDGEKPSKNLWKRFKAWYLAKN